MDIVRVMKYIIIICVGHVEFTGRRGIMIPRKMFLENIMS